MIDTANETRCKNPSCGKPVHQIPGHRRREYCNDTCKQTAYRLRKEQVHHGVTIVDESIQQRIAQLEQRNAELEHLIDRYINTRKRTTQPWKKTLQERWLQLGKAADWPALTIQIHVPAGEREHRLFGMNASNELIEEGNVTLRRQLEERNRNQS